jgi:hypothetical protein
MLQTAQAARHVALLVGACVVLAALASSSAAHDALLQVVGETERAIERNGLLAPAAVRRLTLEAR